MKETCITQYFLEVQVDDFFEFLDFLQQECYETIISG